MVLILNLFYSKNNVINYQKVKFNGIFDFKKQIFLYSLNNNGVPGFDVITPIKLILTKIFLVNRGWIKKDLKGNKNIDNIKSKNLKAL